MIISQYFFLTFNNPAEATTRIGFGTLDESRQKLQRFGFEWRGSDTGIEIRHRRSFVLGGLFKKSEIKHRQQEV